MDWNEVKQGGLRLLELKCPNCGAKLSPESISPQLAAARCSHCHALFTVDAPEKQSSIPRPEVALPKSMKIEERMDGLWLTRRWFGPKAFLLLFFAVVWNGFMIAWNSIALKQGFWPLAAFGSIHTTVGLVLIYIVLGQFLNSTVIRVTRGMLEVKIGPVPWKGNQSVPVHDVTQLYCREKVRHGKNGTSVTYKVEVVLGGNKRETLVEGMETPEEALFVEQQIEKHLGIKDMRVSGEYVH